MPTTSSAFTIDDAKSFDANLTAFVGSLVGDDPALAAVLGSELPRLLSGEIDAAALWDALNAAASARGPS